MKNSPRPLAVFALALCSLTARADVSLPAIFSDHMILQRDARVPVWGTAVPGEKITVEFTGQSVSTTAATDGNWQVALTNLSVGSSPQVLTIRGNNSIVIHDVLVGEVWLGSGQSNMAMTVSRAQNFETEKSAANFPLLRHYKEESVNADSPKVVGKGRWVITTPEEVGAFSAALYFFGRELHQTLRVPVGLINSSVGGTPIEAWIAADVQKNSKEIQAALAALPTATPSAPVTEQQKSTDKKTAKSAKTAKAVSAVRSSAGGLFNGKISPLIPYAIRGALWYQGEANSTPAKAPLYEHQLPLLIRDWRARWGYDFPFAWVQLPNFLGAGRDWPTVREAMLKTLALPHTGMAIAIDVGEANDIHPKNKQVVGHRLAQWALGSVYAKKVAATSGPIPAGHEIRDRAIVLRFKHTDGGLVSKDGPPTGFLVAGSDHVWKPANARIEGNTVVVSSPEVTAPLSARYAWENFPISNLYNGAGLPASPFRTDDWK